MKRILSFLTHPIVISLLGLLLLSLLVWFGGPYIKFGENNAAPLGGTVARLITIMVLIVLWGLNNLRVQLQNKKSNQGLVDDIQQNQADSPKDIGSGQAADEIEQINTRFVDALATLKKLRFKGKGRSKALYELPWYIIVGPPGSGKTTALVNSGLDFPLADTFGKGALQGVGGTRNCDWWFTNDAVLIDTAGRYTTQDSHRVIDSSAWEGFLNLLKRNRRRRPINGAIVAISLHDLLTQTEEERILHAKTIRTRLDELMDKLQIRFPVYLMFTKADMVSGFSEFFEDLGREDRDQVWGLSLPNAPQEGQSPDFDFMSEELNALVSRLYDRVLFRMHQERDSKRRGAIYGFPQQMENLKDIVESFVRQTFVQNRFRFQPYLRGVYFSSGTQDGTPIDRLMTSVSANFGFSRDVSRAANQQGKSYFLTRLFREVIFPEQELVGSNVKYEKFIRWAQRGAFVGMAVITIGLMVVWSASITRHKMYMSEVSEKLAEFDLENKKLSPWNKDVRAVLPPLNALANASIVYDQEEHPWLSGFGLYDGRVDDEANRAYQTHLRTTFQPKLLEALEQVLSRGHEGGDLYNTFRIYMMFNKLDKMEVPMVQEWFESEWDTRFQGEATRRQELKAHLKALLALELQPAELNKTIVAQTRSLLLRVPVSQRIYSRIKSKPEYSQKVDMLNYMGASVRSSFQISDDAARALSVPMLYTIDGYRSVDLSASASVITDIVSERWLLTDDDKEKVDFVSEDLDEISKEVKDLYLADYGKIWHDALASLEVTQFDDLRDAKKILTEFSDPVYSPLRAVLQVGVSNTQLTPAALATVADYESESRTAKLASFAAKRVETTSVDKRFNDLHLLMRESSRGAAPVEEVMERIEEMQQFITEVNLAPEPGKRAFEIARARFQNGEANPITALAAYAQSMPEPIEPWLTALSRETWKVLLQSARRHVNNEWRNQVYAPYSRGLAKRYPLNRSATDELAMYDFSEFFKPEGTMKVFYRDYVQPFVNTNGSWSNKVVDRYSIGFGGETLNQIRNALSITDIFFKAGAEVPSMGLELRPLSMNERDVRFMLELGVDRLSYTHGPRFWKPVTWSGEDDNSRVRMVFEDVDDRSYERTFTGPWAWFRLMDASDLKNTTRSNVYQITFRVGDARDPDSRSIVYEGRAKSVKNPFASNVLSSFRCPESI
ncbi:type VI secretion system membrane subunit TssM [Teredinibacter waterburyi]|jgi:type VI secretion protein IcmF|uniref:type VI secretion system membrane subunit TssM n=1 Tax=Teredinibacter waterburyi TaxID=1500538 RepID=UPI001660008F|nr:type VI secretion system membrane subunit TssM [Teredinibacter waterburyi]